MNPSIATEPGRVRFTFPPRARGLQRTGQLQLQRSGHYRRGLRRARWTGRTRRNGNRSADGQLCRWRQNHHRRCRSSAAASSGSPLPRRSRKLPPQTAAPQPKPPAVPRFLVLIDPAHGGTDSGAAITPSLAEKDVVLALARRVQRELASRGIAAGMLRNSDVAISLDQRAVSANAARPALYITLARRQHRPRRTRLHLDAAGGQPARARDSCPGTRRRRRFLI